MAFVYIFKTGPRQYKIGRTKTNIERRRKELSTGNPNSIELFDYIETEHDSKVEKYLQNKFFEYICETGDSTEHYEITPELLKEGLEEARKFLEGYLPVLEQSEKLSKCKETTDSKPASDEATILYKKLLNIRGKAAILKFEQEYLENKLKVFIGDSDGIDDMITWKVQISTRFDTTGFKNEYPELAEKFSIESKSRVFKILK